MDRDPICPELREGVAAERADGPGVGGADGVRDREHLDLCLAPIDEQFNPIDKTALI